MSDDDVSSVSSAEDNNHGFNLDGDAMSEEEELFRTPTSTSEQTKKNRKKSPTPPSSASKNNKGKGKGAKTKAKGKGKGSSKRQKVEEEEDEDEEEDQAEETAAEQGGDEGEEEAKEEDGEDGEEDVNGATCTELVVHDPDVAEIGEMQMDEDNKVNLDDPDLAKDKKEAHYPPNSVNNIKIAFNVKYKATDLKGKYDLASYLATGTVKAKDPRIRKEKQDQLDLKIAIMDEAMKKRLKNAYEVADAYHTKWQDDYKETLAQWRAKNPDIAARIDACTQARNDRTKAKNKARHEEAAKAAGGKGAKKAPQMKAKVEAAHTVAISSSAISAFDGKDKKNAVLKEIINMRKELNEEILALQKKADDRIDALLKIAIDA